MEGELTKFQMDNSRLKSDIESYSDQLAAANKTMRQERQRVSARGT